jgi:phosphoesterase RecJ-like protein
LNIPSKYLKPLSKIKKTILSPENKSFLIVGHVNPDGDNVGAALALYSLLKRIKNASVEIYSRDPVPYFLKFLKNADKIKVTQRVTGKYDVAIVLDSLNVARTGDIIKLPGQASVAIKIDHHTGRETWADIDWSDSSASSVSEMVYMLFKSLRKKPDENEAEAIYTGIVTDTHDFTQLNTTRTSHEVAGELLDCGVKQSKVEKNVYGTKRLAALKLLGGALSNMEVHPSGKIAYVTVTGIMFKTTGTGSADTEDFINYAGMVPGVLVWMMFKEISGSAAKVSFRSVQEVDVNEIAGAFGGGGHKNASGCTVNAPVSEAVKKVVGYVDEYLKRHKKRLKV